MKRAAFLLFAVISVFDALAAYPIDPMPLRRLVGKSEYIISGYVLELVQKEDKGDDFETHIARIEVVEVLKGTIQESMLEIGYAGNMICPSPPHFVAHTDVVLFLRKDGNTYTTVALSYGLKTLDRAGVELYKTRIKEIQQIETLIDEDDRFLQTVEWLVKCTESPATRWEGTYELSPSSDFMSYYSRTQPEPFYQMLTKEQKERLKNALLANCGDYRDFALIDLVYADYRAEVRSYLLQRLQQVDDGHLWFVNGYMNRLLYDNDSAELKKLADNFAGMQYKAENKTEMKAIISQFVTLAAR